MPKLPAEAYAIIEGRHADPFHYLGLHPEGGKSVVRAFLPEASNVEAVGEQGEVASLDRVHDAGLFIGALPNGSKHYQLRAKFGGAVGKGCVGDSHSPGAASPGTGRSSIGKNGCPVTRSNTKM